MRSEVQLLPGPPFRGLSSVGRAVALQASGHRFDPDRLHHFHSLSVEMVVKFSRDEDTSSASADLWGICPLFDIVNGF